MSTAKGKKRIREQPVLYDEPKKKRGVMLTNTAWHKIQELAARNCMSASEYLEQMIRNHSMIDG